MARITSYWEANLRVEVEDRGDQLQFYSGRIDIINLIT
jgi:hypothetical protein